MMILHNNRKSAKGVRALPEDFPSLLQGRWPMLSEQTWDLEKYRPMLRLHVQIIQKHPRVQSRLGDSDLVQETLAKAWERLPQFRGQSEGELIRWLQRILSNVVADEVDKLRAQKRDVAREQSLQAALAESSMRMEKYLAADQSSPSEQAEKQEELMRLAVALELLDPIERDVLICHYLLD